MGTRPKPDADGKRQFGRRLYDAMAQSHKNQYELARLIGTSQPVIANYCSGRCYPSTETLVRLCRALFVSPSYLLGFASNEPLMAEAKEKEENRAFLLDIYEQISNHLFDGEGEEK